MLMQGYVRIEGGSVEVGDGVLFNNNAGDTEHIVKVIEVGPTASETIVRSEYNGEVGTVDESLSDVQKRFNEATQVHIRKQ